MRAIKDVKSLYKHKFSETERLTKVEILANK